MGQRWGGLILAVATIVLALAGLLDYLLPRFTAETGIQVKEIAVGTGQALGLASRGDADVVLVHAPKSELAFVAAGDGMDRAQVMYNYFVLVGPAGDPASAAGNDTAAAFRRIAGCGCTFFSRGDGSGTHTRELQLWSAAGSAPESGGWYKETGQGMGATLRIANQLRGYTLSDDGTFYVMKPQLDLAVLVENQPPLLNQYSVILVNQTKHPNVRFNEARVFHDWLVGIEGQELIGLFGIAGYFPFHPNARAAPP